MKTLVCLLILLSILALMWHVFCEEVDTLAHTPQRIYRHSKIRHLQYECQRCVACEPDPFYYLALMDSRRDPDCFTRCMFDKAGFFNYTTVSKLNLRVRRWVNWRNLTAIISNEEALTCKLISRWAIMECKPVLDCLQKDDDFCDRAYLFRKCYVEKSRFAFKFDWKYEPMRPYFHDDMCNDEWCKYKYN